MIRPVPSELRNGIPLNNNRNNNNNNNRRRGRGNRNQGNGGGGQSNRIDSRARGNAPQLLDKYKKLAEDAHRNGDRVQAEYYLQFADHYFRVIADNRVRQDEQRGDQRSGRRDERELDDFESGEDESESEDNRRFESRDKREPRRERPRRDDTRNGNGNGNGNGARSDHHGDAEPVEASEGPAYEPDDNPFTRDARDDRESRPKRRAPRPRHGEEPEATFDAAVLPPSISAIDAGDDERGEIAEEPAPRRRRKRGEGGTLSAVG